MGYEWAVWHRYRRKALEGLSERTDDQHYERTLAMWLG